MSGKRRSRPLFLLFCFVLPFALSPGLAAAQGQGNGGGKDKGGGEIWDPPIQPLDVTDSIPPALTSTPSLRRRSRMPSARCGCGRPEPGRYELRGEGLFLGAPIPQ